MTLSRRALLRGFGGLMIGLPLLESLPRQAKAQSVTGARRFIVFFEHGGTISAASKTGKKYDGNGKNNGVDAWAPASPAEALELGAIHQPLAQHVGSLLVLRGIDNRACALQSPYNGDHGWANVTALTSAEAAEVGEDQTSLRAFDRRGARRTARRKKQGHVSFDQSRGARSQLRHSVLPRRAPAGVRRVQPGCGVQQAVRRRDHGHRGAGSRAGAERVRSERACSTESAKGSAFSSSGSARRTSARSMRT